MKNVNIETLEKLFEEGRSWSVVAHQYLPAHQPNLLLPDNLIQEEFYIEDYQYFTDNVLTSCQVLLHPVTRKPYVNQCKESPIIAVSTTDKGSSLENLIWKIEDEVKTMIRENKIKCEHFISIVIQTEEESFIFIFESTRFNVLINIEEV